MIPLPCYAEDKLTVKEIESMKKEGEYKVLFVPLAAQEVEIERGMEESLRFFRVFKRLSKEPLPAYHFR